MNALETLQDYLQKRWEENDPTTQAMRNPFIAPAIAIGGMRAIHVNFTTGGWAWCFHCRDKHPPGEWEIYRVVLPPSYLASLKHEDIFENTEVILGNHCQVHYSCPKAQRKNANGVLREFLAVDLQSAEQLDKFTNLALTCLTAAAKKEETEERQAPSQPFDNPLEAVIRMAESRIQDAQRYAEANHARVQQFMESQMELIKTVLQKLIEQEPVTKAPVIPENTERLLRCGNPQTCNKDTVHRFIAPYWRCGKCGEIPARPNATHVADVSLWRGSENEPAQLYLLSEWKPLKGGK